MGNNDGQVISVNFKSNRKKTYCTCRPVDVSEYLRDYNRLNVVWNISYDATLVVSGSGLRNFYLGYSLGDLGTSHLQTSHCLQILTAETMKISKISHNSPPESSVS